MKLDSNSAVGTVLSEDLTEKNFGILANEKMFSILSSKIYSDKILAPIRELSCNAYDAHVMVGKKNIPFEVHLPTNEELFFAVEDFGPGMDAYEIEELYTTYGYSSKTTSNRFVGCLGLGSKSPFAYTDSFRIISRKKRKEYLYQCSIDNGMPKLIKFDESETEKPSGVRIEFNVDRDDIYSFRYKAEELFRYFNPRPNFNVSLGFSPIPEFHHDISLTKDDYGRRIVLMGNVAYSYRLDNFTDNEEYNDFVEKFKGTSTIVKANIGDIEIAASRESAEMKPKTMDFISRKHMEYAKIILEEMKAKKPEFNSVFDYLFAYGKFIKANPFVDHGDFFEEVHNFSIPLENSIDIVRVYNRNGNTHERISRKLEKEFRIENYVFQNNSVQFVYSIQANLTSSAGINDYVDSTKGTEVYLFNDESFKKKLEYLNIPVKEKKDFLVAKQKVEKQKIEKSVEGILIAKSRAYYETTSSNMGFKFYPANSEFVEKLESLEKVYYVKTRFHSIDSSEFKKWMDFGLKLECFQWIEEMIKEQNSLVIGVNEWRRKKIEDDPKYVDLIEYVIKTFSKDCKAYKKAEEAFQRDFIHRTFGFLFFLNFKKEFLPEELQDIYRISHSKENEGLTSIENNFGNIYKFVEDSSKISQFKGFLVDRYPMLQFINLDSSYEYFQRFGDDIKIMQKYIDEIDSAKGNKSTKL